MRVVTALRRVHNDARRYPANPEREAVTMRVVTPLTMRKRGITMHVVTPLTLRIEA